MTWRSSGVVLALALGVLCAGCRGPARGPSAGAGAADEAAAGADAGRFDHTDALAISGLRERAIERLEALASSSDPQVRANAIEALGALPSRVETVAAAGLRDGNEGVRAVAAMVVGRARVRSLGPAVERLTQDPSGYVQSAAIYASRRLGREVDLTPLGRLLLGSSDPRLRAHAAFLLGELGEASAVPMLREAYASPMPRASQAAVRLMRLQIAEAMVKLGDESQLSVIRAALYPSRPEELEATALAVQVLGEVRDEAAVDQLISLSAQTDRSGNPMPAEVRLATASSLARLGLRQGSFLADEYVGSELAPVRAQAATVYGRTGKVDNLGKLAALLEDGSQMVQVAAAAGIVAVSDVAQLRGAGAVSDAG